MVFIVGLAGILFTVVLHAVTTTLLIATVKSESPKLRARISRMSPTMLLGITSLILSFKHAMDIVLWGLAYWYFLPSQFGSFHDAVYFSSVTYTTLGYGDIVIEGSWRILSSFEAIGGMILFGISTALLFVIIQQLWLRELIQSE